MIGRWSIGMIASGAGGLHHTGCLCRRVAGAEGAVAWQVIERHCVVKSAQGREQAFARWAGEEIKVAQAPCSAFGPAGHLIDKGGIACCKCEAGNCAVDLRTGEENGQHAAIVDHQRCYPVQMGKG